MIMKCVAVVVVLGFLSRGHAAPLTSCESLVKPIQISSEEMLGRWLYIGGSSDLPGSRSLGRLLTSASLVVTPTTESNILNLIQTQRIYGHCSSLTYNVTFENSTLLIESPFYLKEVYLRTDCPDCLVVYEEIHTDNDTFTSLLLFSRRKTVSPATLETFMRQAECLKMTSPIMLDTNYEICPNSTASTVGLDDFNTLLVAKMGHRVARVLDAFFDMFVN